MESIITVHDMATLQRVLGQVTKTRESLPPCFILYGTEDFLLRELLDRLITIILPPEERDLNLFSFDGESENIESLCEALLTPPLIPGSKVVLLRNSRLFYTRKVLPDVLQRIRDRFESVPDKAAKDFMDFLSLTGWTIDDLRDDGWKKITNEEWQKTVDGDSGEDRERWLPVLVEYCVSHDLTSPRFMASDVERLCAILEKGLPGGIHLILTASAVDTRKRLFKIISRIGKVFFFPEVKRESVKKQSVIDASKELLSQSGKMLTPAAWNILGRKTGFDFSSSMEAVKMLISYVGERRVIQEEDVEEVIGRTREETVFDLTSALVEKNVVKAIITLKHLFEQGEHHLKIFSIIARELRFLLYAKVFMNSGKLHSCFHHDMDFSEFQTQVYPLIREWSAAQTKNSRLELFEQHPYVIFNVLKNSFRFRDEELRNYLEKLVAMDIVFKTTATNPQIMLERFVAEVCADD